MVSGHCLTTNKDFIAVFNAEETYAFGSLPFEFDNLWSIFFWVKFTSDAITLELNFKSTVHLTVANESSLSCFLEPNNTIDLPEIQLQDNTWYFIGIAQRYNRLHLRVASLNNGQDIKKTHEILYDNKI